MKNTKKNLFANRKSILFCCFIFAVFSSYSISHQSKDDVIIIEGQIISKKDGQPIPYVNIGISDTYMGTITNLEGFFEIRIPTEHSGKNLLISAVGFNNLTLPVSAYADKHDVVIELEPQNYKIKEVDVTAKSMRYLKIIKKAVASIHDNYPQQPFNYECYYRSEVVRNDSLDRLREAAVTIFDRNGYKRGNAYEVYKQRNYKFTQVRRNFQLTSLVDGSTYLDGLLEMDIVRVRGNILDTNHLHLYDLELEKITEYDNDSVYVISYTCKEPSLSVTGDYYATAYAGKLYINTSDYAIVKNETNVEASNYSEHGRSVYVDPEKQEWRMNEVMYYFSVIYKKKGGKYYLSYVNYNRYHKKTHKETKRPLTESIHTELMVNKIILDNPEVISKRAYYENIPYDEAFWKQYNIMPDRE